MAHAAWRVRAALRRWRDVGVADPGAAAAAGSGGEASRPLAAVALLGSCGCDWEE